MPHICVDGSISCSICAHENRVDIDRAIMADDSDTSIAKKWHISRTTIRSHRKECMARTDAMLIAAAPSINRASSRVIPYETTANLAAKEDLATTTLATYLRIAQKLENQIDECIADKDRRNIAGIAQAVLRACAQATDKIGGNINVQVNNDIRNSAEWKAMMRLTRAHPELNDELLSYLA